MRFIRAVIIGEKQSDSLWHPVIMRPGELLQAYEDKCATAMDVETRVLMVHSSFASIAGRGEQNFVCIIDGMHYTTSLVFLLRRSNLRQHTLVSLCSVVELCTLTQERKVRDNASDRTGAVLNHAF
jgi:hypothetical protein